MRISVTLQYERFKGGDLLYFYIFIDFRLVINKGD